MIHDDVSPDRCASPCGGTPGYVLLADSRNSEAGLPVRRREHGSGDSRSAGGSVPLHEHSGPGIYQQGLHHGRCHGARRPRWAGMADISLSPREMVQVSFRTPRLRRTLFRQVRRRTASTFVSVKRLHRPSGDFGGSPARVVEGPDISARRNRRTRWRHSSSPVSGTQAAP